MRGQLVLFIALPLAVACQNNNPYSETEKNINPVSKSGDSTELVSGQEFGQPTEIYSGFINGEETIFEHKNYTRYRLTRAGKISTGSLNTERGFGKDRNATLFILNDNKPDAGQLYFVRFSDGRFVMLNADKKEMPGANFSKY